MGGQTAGSRGEAILRCALPIRPGKDSPADGRAHPWSHSRLPIPAPPYSIDQPACVDRSWPVSPPMQYRRLVNSRRRLYGRPHWSAPSVRGEMLSRPTRRCQCIPHLAGSTLGPVTVTFASRHHARSVGLSHQRSSASQRPGCLQVTNITFDCNAPSLQIPSRWLTV